MARAHKATGSLMETDMNLNQWGKFGIIFHPSPLRFLFKQQKKALTDLMSSSIFRFVFWNDNLG
jgi:hypothetical protein